MKRRFVSMLLAVLLVVSILPVAVFADNPAKNITVKGSYTDGKLTAVTVEFGWGVGFLDVSNAKGVLQTALLDGQEVGDDVLDMGDFSDDGEIYKANKSEAQSSADYGFIKSSLTSNGGNVSCVYDNEVTLEIPGGLDAGTYYVYLWVTFDDRFYPDALLCVINVAADGTATYTPAISGELRNAFSTNVQEYRKIEDKTNPNPPAHTHTWKIDTAGNGTKEAKAAIHCTGADCNLNGQYMEVKLTADDVTLPGNAFPITVTVDYGIGRNNDFAVFTISEEPGFKYSADGTGYVDIDPATFVAKQGHYQASIMIMENNDDVENLYVKYTVSDPVVTAATGDERPIEMMLVGLAAFSAMAAMAFIMDSKRRMVR